MIFLIFHSDNSHEDNTLQYLCSVNQQRRILLVAATAVEMECFGLDAPYAAGFQEKVKGDNVDALITGLGIPATAFHLGRILAMNTYDLVMNTGLAGSFSADLTKRYYVCTPLLRKGSIAQLVQCIPTHSFSKKTCVSGGSAVRTIF